MRPSVPAQIVREALYAFAAICPETGQIAATILPTANTEMMNIFLKQVSQEFAETQNHPLPALVHWELDQTGIA